MRKVIVTGGLGFIGSNLIKILNKKKFFIINIDKITYASNKKNIQDNIKYYKFYKEDINNKNFIISILKKYQPSLIFNLAAETHVDRSIDSPKNFINSNILGVFNLLEAIRSFKKNVKLINISTDEVYGDINILSSKENYAYNPSSPYSASKASGDMLIKSYIRTFNIPAIITNCCNNYGPNQYPEKLIPTIIFKILKNQTIPIYGSGKNIREWIHVKDHCEALIKIAFKGKIGENYNIGSGIKIKNIEMMKKIISIFKEINTNPKNIVNFLFVKDRPGHDFRYSLNSSKIKNELKWKCKINFTEGLRETVYWYIDKFNNNYFKNKNFRKD
jgi:dTDP-glucose 4,6-dehydratase